MELKIIGFKIHLFSWQCKSTVVALHELTATVRRTSLVSAAFFGECSILALISAFLVVS